MIDIVKLRALALADDLAEYLAELDSTGSADLDPVRSSLEALRQAQLRAEAR